MIERQLIAQTPENHRSRQPNKSESAGSADRPPQGMPAIYLDFHQEPAGPQGRADSRKYAPGRQFVEQFLVPAREEIN